MKHSRDFYPECPDPMLVSLAREGDQDAFAQVVVRHQAAMRSMFRRMCGELSLADDLSQQAFLQAYVKIAEVKNEQAFSGWLKRLGVNIWLQHCRKHDVLLEAEPTDQLNDVEPDSALAVDLNSALRSLSPVVRLCVVLSYQEGMSHREISDTTQLPLGTVKSHISRGAAKLNMMLKAYGPTESNKGSKHE